MSRDAFAESVTEAQRLAQPGLRFPAPHRRATRRYARNFSTCSSCGPRPPPERTRRHRGAAQHDSDNARKVPTDAPTEFIKPRWQKLVMTDTGIDRRYYELCALSG
nr:hypothetical protein [Klebsiella pneumoniae]